MKIIKTIADIKELKFGDQYIIEPKGLDYQKPETIIEASTGVAKLQSAVEKHIEEITSEPKKVKVKEAKKVKG